MLWPPGSDASLIQLHPLEPLQEGFSPPCRCDGVVPPRAEGLIGVHSHDHSFQLGRSVLLKLVELFGGLVNGRVVREVVAQKAHE